VVRIDVFADGDDDLAAVGLPHQRALQPAPDLGLRRAVGEPREDDRPQIAEGLVHDDPQDVLDGQAVAQMFEEQGLQG
jgi:hypothetical protein